MDEPRCPRCAALVRPGAPWCTLCYADLRPARPAEPVAANAQVGPGSGAEPVRLAVPVTDVTAATEAEQGDVAESPQPARRGKHARPAVAAVAAEPAKTDAVAEELLAALAAESRPTLSRFSGEVDSTGAKVAVMTVGALVVTGVLFALMTAVGALL